MRHYYLTNVFLVVSAQQPIVICVDQIIRWCRLRILSPVLQKKQKHGGQSMKTPGFVYALINPSLPGLVKVGLTTNHPNDRAVELSSATGVPTPFIVVYYDYFDDCEYAEQWVHETLQQKGRRVSDSREFFNADITDVIKIISSCCGRIPLERISSVESHNNTLQHHSNALFVNGVGNKEITTNPADALFLEAEATYYGVSDKLMDRNEAVKLYKKAVRLGSSDAYLRLAQIDKNTAKSLSYLLAGANKGNYYCFAEIALKHYSGDQWAKCWDKFFSCAKSGTRPIIAIDIECYYSLYIEDVACKPYAVLHTFDHSEKDMVLKWLNRLLKAYTSGLRKYVYFGSCKKENADHRRKYLQGLICLVNGIIPGVQNVVFNNNEMMRKLRSCTPENGRSIKLERSQNEKNAVANGHFIIQYSYEGWGRLQDMIDVAARFSDDDDQSFRSMTRIA